MKRIMKKVLVALCILMVTAFAGQALAEGGKIKKEFTGELNFHFVNDTDKIAIYNLLWVDHSFKDHPGPVSLAVGEIQPGEDNNVDVRYSSGIWIIKWFDQGGDNTTARKYILIYSTDKKIISKRSAPELEVIDLK